MAAPTPRSLGELAIRPESGWSRFTIWLRSAESQLANISTRGLVQSGDNVMIGGFIITGTESGQRDRARARAVASGARETGRPDARTGEQRRRFRAKQRQLAERPGGGDHREHGAADGRMPRPPSSGRSRPALTPRLCAARTRVAASPSSRPTTFLRLGAPGPGANLTRSCRCGFLARK